MTRETGTTSHPLPARTAFLFLLIFLMATALLPPGWAEAQSVGEGQLGIGTSPASLFLDSTFHGETRWERIWVHVTCTACPAQDPVEIKLGCSGDICGWMSFYDDDQVTPIEKAIITLGQTGTAGKWLWAKFTIPEDAPVGLSTGTFKPSAAPLGSTAGEGETGVSLILGSPMDITISVIGTPIFSAIADNFGAKDTESGYPARIQYRFQNTGNVRAAPQTTITVLKDGKPVDTFGAPNQDVTTVNVGAKLTITAEMDTKFVEPGEYEAEVSVSLQDAVVGTGKVKFAVLPRGTLTRAGAFTNLELDEANPAMGTLAKMLAHFTNLGQIDTRARFEAEIYRDGKLIDSLQSGEVLVPTGQSGIVIAYYKVETPGTYRVDGYINYEGKITDRREISFTVAPESGQAPPNTPASSESDEGGSSSSTVIWIVVGVIIALILVGGAIYLTRRRTKEKPNPSN